MILTRKEIIKEINQGDLVITPYNKKNIGPASIDLTLDSKLRIFKSDLIVSLDKCPDIVKITKKISITKFVLEPGQLVLGITKEKISLPSYLAGWLQGRSCFARIGLFVHITASFVHPGVSNKQVLEIYNAAAFPLVLKPGIKICQLIIEQTLGQEIYKGKYLKQTSV